MSYPVGACALDLEGSACRSRPAVVTVIRSIRVIWGYQRYTWLDPRRGKGW